jgi:hypothetical protein
VVATTLKQDSFVVDVNSKVSLGALNEVCKISTDPLITDIKRAVGNLYPGTKIIELGELIEKINELNQINEDDKHAHRLVWTIETSFLLNTVTSCIATNRN